MSEIVDQSLLKIARGGVLILIGIVIGMILDLVVRVIIVRYISQNEYGIYSLSLALFNAFAILSILGLETGAPRQIGLYRGKGDKPKVEGTVLSSLQIAVISGICFSLILFFTSDVISSRLFHNPELLAPLRFLCIALPFYVLIHILSSVFRGFDRAEPTVYFQQISQKALFPLLLAIAIFLNLQLMGVFYAFIASFLLTFVAFFIYTVRKLPLNLRGRSSSSTILPEKELLLYSLPLLVVAALNYVTGWTDTLMLGYFKESDAVGLYNAALPLAHALGVVLIAFGFLFIPLMSQLYARNQIKEIKRSYTILTKWSFAATLPIFLIFVFFPEVILRALFGPQYEGASITLQILGSGFLINNIMGLNSATLITMGKARFVMWSTLFAVILNIILNMVLIPDLGIIGAAIATATTLAMKNILWSVGLYSLARIHPFTRNFLKPFIALAVLIVVVLIIVKSLFSATPVWLLPLFFLLFIGVYGISLLVTRSFDKEDITMLLKIEKRSGLNLTLIKRIVKRFL